MFPYFRHNHNNNNNNLFIILPLFLSLLHTFPARPIPVQVTELTVHSRNSTWHNFAKFVGAGKGTNHTGMSELKKYFQRFGYLGISENNNLTDTFDEGLQAAVLSYQKRLGLPVTGQLDSNTVKQIMSPRCGVSDDHRTNNHHHHGTRFHDTKHYADFPGEPRWSKSTPMNLTYAFSSNHMIDYIDISEIKSVFRRSFSRWSSVIPVNFTESDDYDSSEIKIGFYDGDHGDGVAFDGVLGVLAHAFSPEDGKLHLDGAETWAVDFKLQKSKKAVDLESVVTHEIGHILGLAHSTVKDAIMYPILNPRTKKVDLRIDDVEGIQALYGSNPNFKYSSLLESDISSSWEIGLERRSSIKWVISCLVFVVSFLCFLL